MPTRYRYVLVDSNAFIFHPHDPEHRAVLNGAEAPLESRRAMLLRYLPQMAMFYQNWNALLEAEQPCFFVTDALLDLELSGWRFINKNPKRYQSRYRRRSLPRGDLIQDFDSKKSRKAKNTILQVLDRKCRINSALKRHAKGVRQLIEADLLSRPIWSRALKTEGLSLLDKDLLVNALAAGTVGPTALLTNDRALRQMTISLRKYLKNPAWAAEAKAEMAGALSRTKLDLCSWDRQGQDLYYSADS
jgi:hypothetical protein